MNQYEELLQEAADNDVRVIEQYDFSNTRLKGMYCDGTVALDKEINTNCEKKCVLAEEIGHHHTAYGDITLLKSISSRKQELHGRLWAYNKLIGLSGIISAYKAGCTNLYEMSSYLDVTEEFLGEALSCYISKYSPYVYIDNYVIYFEPTIVVMELI